VLAQNLVEVHRLPARTLAKHGIGCDGGGYGCWFWVKNGTGVYVAAGRSKIVGHKQQVYPWIHSTVNMSEIKHALQPCVAANTRHEAKTDEHPLGCDALRHSEPGICAAARKRGFQSVLMDQPPSRYPGGYGRRTELVLCNDWCMRHVSCDECPPVMQNLTGQCACDPTVGVSNC